MVAFASSRDGNYEIYSMNADGTDQTRLTNNTDMDQNPTVSPDGSQVAFTSDRDGNWEVYVMKTNGSGQRNRCNPGTERAGQRPRRRGRSA